MNMKGVEGHKSDLSSQKSSQRNPIDDDSEKEDEKTKLERISSLVRQEHDKMQSVKNTCFSSLYNDELFSKVTDGPTLKNNMQGLFLKGESVLDKEIEYAKRIPEKHRIFYKNHFLTELGEGEPHQPGQEIVIEQNNAIKQHVKKHQKIDPG